MRKQRDVCLRRRRRRVRMSLFRRIYRPSLPVPRFEYSSQHYRAVPKVLFQFQELHVEAYFIEDFCV